MKTVTRSFFVGVSVLAAFAGFACSHHRSPEKRAEWIVSKVSSKLDLTEEQKSKLDAVKAAVLDLHKEHQADRTQHLEELKAWIMSEKLEVTRVKALMAQRQKAMDQNVDRVFGKVSEFHSSLSTEQKKKAVELIDKFASHWE